MNKYLLNIQQINEGTMPSSSSSSPSLLNDDQAAAAFRTAMRNVASSVTLIAVEIEGHRFGMIATAMMSVSLEPPTLAVCVNRCASIHEPLRSRKAFSVNVLSESQQDLSYHFTRGTQGERFNKGDWHSHPHSNKILTGLPFLRDAAAVFFGYVREQVVCGTHTLFIADIEDAAMKQFARPLLYCDGAYGSFAA